MSAQGNLPLHSVPLLDSEGVRAEIAELCKNRGVPMDVLTGLVRMELGFVGSGRRHGLDDKIAELLNGMQGDGNVVA